jgi:hypothetical protein
MQPYHTLKGSSAGLVIVIGQRLRTLRTYLSAVCKFRLKLLEDFGNSPWKSQKEGLGSRKEARGVIRALL